MVLRDVLARLKLSESLADDGIRATRPIGFPAALGLLSAIEPYGMIEQRLRSMTVRPEAVLSFGYDWRRSIAAAGRRLGDVARAHLEAWRRRFAELPVTETAGLRPPRLTFVCHSMGGLAARWFAEVEGGRDVTRAIVTLGTPFAGSLNAVRVLADGDYLPFGLYATSMRDAARTMRRGLYELVAIYDCVHDGGGARAISPADLRSIGAGEHLADAASGVHRCWRTRSRPPESSGVRCAASSAPNSPRASQSGSRMEPRSSASPTAASTSAATGPCFAMRRRCRVASRIPCRKATGR